jgi:hypothetical protein
LQGQHLLLVIKETSAALKLNPNYVKALHRRSKSYKVTGCLEEALEGGHNGGLHSGAVLHQLADDILKELWAPKRVSAS